MTANTGTTAVHAMGYSLTYYKNIDHGRANGLLRGANVIMPNLTPTRYRELYQIYPGKAGLHETADVTTSRIRAQIEALGRAVGTGPGTSPRLLARSTEA